jgi:hypothetical protein
MAMKVKKFDENKKIKIIEKNPKKNGTEAYKRYALYRTGMTVGQALEKGVKRMDLTWDSQHKFIEIR